MTVKVLFLGRLEDAAGAAERVCEAGAGKTLGDLVATFPAALAQALSDSRLRVAINGVLVGAPLAAVLARGDEVAFLPPVSGG